MRVQFVPARLAPLPERLGQLGVVVHGLRQVPEIPAVPPANRFERVQQPLAEGGRSGQVGMPGRAEHPPGEPDIGPRRRQPVLELLAERRRHLIGTAAQGRGERAGARQQFRQSAVQQPAGVGVSRQVLAEQLGEHVRVAARPVQVGLLQQRLDPRRVTDRADFRLGEHGQDRMVGECLAQHQPAAARRPAGDGGADLRGEPVIHVGRMGIGQDAE